ncbi:MAG: hypothetical protein R3F60_05790 [bacterium]
MPARAWTSAVAWLLSGGLAWAGPPETPCARVEGPVAALAARLGSTRDRGAFARLAQDAAALVDAGTPHERACAAYTAGSAWFFLSAQGADRRYHAAAAVGGLLRAQQLDPEGMAARQPVSRLREAWLRVGAVPGWLEPGRDPAAVTLPAREGTLRLAPADPAAWKVACGATASCDGAADVEVALSPAGPIALSLRPGQYAVTLTTPCGTARHTTPVAGGTLALPPEPACPVAIDARDGVQPVADVQLLDAAGRALDPGSLRADGGPVTVAAPGFEPRRVSLPTSGGTLEVPLVRCAVELVVVVARGRAGGGRRRRPLGPATRAGRAAPAMWIWTR